jgi:hypothetical protein
MGKELTQFFHQTCRISFHKVIHFPKAVGSFLDNANQMDLHENQGFLHDSSDQVMSLLSLFPVVV